jgi:PAS domain S-box-containing protein
VDDVRQRFLVREGIEERETPREVSFCAHTLGSNDLMEVRDTTEDPRFAANPLVTGGPEVRFYAGQPLISDEGAALGTICVVDLKPRPEGLTHFQREGMAMLAQAVMRRMHSRRSDIRAKREIEERELRLRRMIDGVPQIAWSADDQGNFDYFNARWEKNTGALPPKLSEDWRRFIHPDDQPKVFAAWAEAFREGEQFDAEYRLLKADGSWCWVLGRACPVAAEVGGARRWFGTITDIDEVHRLSESRDLLSKELAHRIKNIFAVVIGLTMLKARAAPEHLAFANDVTSALNSLASAHSFVRVSGGPLEENLHALLTSLFLPYVDEAGRSRVRVSGSDCAIVSRAATPLALVFHELATNSAKYGALSVPDGRVELLVVEDGENFTFVWRELDGPLVEDTGKRGFGSRLVEMAVKGQLQGTWARDFAPDGLTVEINAPKVVLAG